jgi:hypothetical protein
MLSPLLPRAEDLELWATTYEAVGQLPRMIRRLIAASGAFTRLEFPADDAVRFDGWDGIACAAGRDPWLPGGVSGWEMTCDARPRVGRKAASDYGKRTRNALGLTQAETTFVFVTPREWAGKHRWVNARVTSPWRAVRALDATDLETWLESSSAVHVWLAEVMGRRLDGITTLDTIWNEWARVSTPAITPAFLLAGRDEQGNAVRQWLTGDAASYAVRADSPDEARAFIAAAADQGAGQDPLANVLVVSERGAWRQLLQLPGQRFVLVPDFDEPDANGAVGCGHTVIHALGPDEPFNGAAVRLAPLNRDQAAAALVAAGVGEVEARSLASEAWRGLLAFRRQHAVNQAMRRAAWATTENVAILIAAMLAGSWDSDSGGDRTAISELCGGRPYEEVEASLQILSARADPPVRRIGRVWSVASKMDVWTQLAGIAPPAVWQTFERLALDFSSERDPRLDLAPDAGIMAIATAGARAHSDRLRHGLVNAVAFVGSRGPGVVLSDGRSTEAVATKIVRDAMDRANDDATGTIWAAISDSLPSLAEASPAAFVRGVESALRGPAIQRLMPDPAREQTLFGPHVDYTQMAMALAMVAWDQTQFAAAGNALASLARLATHNDRRQAPADYLVQVLLPWYPQTAASIDQQLDLLTRLQDREPDIAWQVLLKLIPNAMQTTTDTQHPQYRAWRGPGPRSLARSEWLRLVEGISSRLVQQAVAQPARLPKLIENYADLAPRAQAELREELARLDMAATGVDRTAIADALREEVARHRAHHEAAWAMPPGAVDELEALFPALAPEDPIERSKWLFGDHPDMESVSGEDYQNYDENLRRLRGEALAEIIGARGLAGVEAMVDAAASPRAVGLGLARDDAVGDCDIVTWGRSDDARKREAARFFFAVRVRLKGDDLASEILEGTCPLPADAAGSFLAAAVPPRRTMWALAARLGPEAEAAYWRDFYGFPETGEEAAEAVGHLLARNRPWAAIDLLGMEVHHRRPLDPEQAMRALSLAATATPPQAGGMVGYDVAQILGALVDQGVPDNELAPLEWTYLRVLDHGDRQPRALHAMLASQPEFFIEALSAIYRAEDEEVREGTPEEGARASQAWWLLAEWKRPPGVGSDGTVDADALVAWVRRARELAAEAQRTHPADSKIGAVLRHVPPGTDGHWPHEAVRDLLEELQSDELENGMAIEVMNSRGVVTRGPNGGQQEREIAAVHVAAAQALSARWPRAAAMLTMLAAEFETEARRHDVDARIHEEDWG